MHTCTQPAYLFPVTDLIHSFNNNELNPPCRPGSLPVAEGKPHTERRLNLYLSLLHVTLASYTAVTVWKDVQDLLQVRLVVRPSHDPPHSHSGTEPDVKTRRITILSVFPDTVEIDEKGATPDRGRINYVCFPEVTEDEACFMNRKGRGRIPPDGLE